MLITTHLHTFTCSLFISFFSADNTSEANMEGLSVQTRISPMLCVSANCLFALCVTGAGEPEEDELYESGVQDSNGVYRLQGDKLVPHEDAWASIPSVTLLNSKDVTEQNE